MQNEINLTRLNMYYKRLKRYVDTNDLSVLEFENYYTIFKEFVYSGLFSPEHLKQFAESLLNVNLCIVNVKDIEKLKTYHYELKTFVEFINDMKKIKIKKFENVKVKKCIKFKLINFNFFYFGIANKTISVGNI